MLSACCWTRLAEVRDIHFVIYDCHGFNNEYSFSSILCYTNDLLKLLYLCSMLHDPFHKVTFSYLRITSRKYL